MISESGRPFARVSDREREQLLRDALAGFTSKGWEVDDLTTFTATAAKEWSWEYAFPPAWFNEGALTFRRGGLNIFRDKVYKRRLLAVDKEGGVTVTKLRSRGEKSSRYHY